MTADYEPFARTHLGADTWRVRQFQLASLEDGFGKLRLSEITTAHVDAYKAARLDVVTATTVNNELRVLATVLRWAREERAQPVPEIRVRKLRQVARRVRVWTPAEVRKLLATCERLDPDLVPMLVFMLNTGCRKGETVAALWTWVRRGTLSVGAYEGWAPKSRRPREIPISDALASLLAELPRTSTRIFPNANGEPFKRFPNDRLAPVLKAAWLKGSPHTCRHTFASMFLASGQSLFDLSALLGHSATRTTELYAHLLPGHLDRARNAVNLDARGRNPGATLAKRRASA